MDLSLLQPGYLPRFEAEKSLEMKPTDRGSIGACGVRLPSTTQPMVDPDLVEYPNRQFYTISDVACGGIATCRVTLRGNPVAWFLSSLARRPIIRETVI